MNYQVIKDEAALKAFIAWLPDLLPTEKYYLTLLARKKYDATLTMSDLVLKRVVGKKEELFTKIRQLEVPLGAYVTRKDEPISQDALALYINVNPRSMAIATKNAVKELVTLICEEKELTIIPQSVALTAIHGARGTKHFVDIDIDDVTLVPEQVLEVATNFVEKEAISVVKTRGGVHLLLQTKLITTKDWFRKLRDKFTFDVTGDNMVPVPGTHQGGAVPYMIRAK